SRHLKLLGEAGLVGRFKEGSWVFCRAADRGVGAELGAAIAALADPNLQESDKARLAPCRQPRAAAGGAHLKANAAEWERIRALHAPERDVEAAIARHLTSRPIDNFLDAGTGTGRMLELIAPHAARAVGIDVSPDMLAIARDRLLRENVRNAQVRLGDIYRLPFPNGAAGAGFDVGLFHPGLDYLDHPGRAGTGAARVMTPGGRLLIADFAPHKEEFLREEFAHRRLGFSDREVEGWFAQAGLANAGSETIAPKAEGEKLTVKLWLAGAKARTRKEAA